MREENACRGAGLELRTSQSRGRVSSTRPPYHASNPITEARESKFPSSTPGRVTWHCVLTPLPPPHPRQISPLSISVWLAEFPHWSFCLSMFC
ncbi:hypothetical protein ElyMa_000065300 [Elysia marginata]|uniref:Uncharacterized protein n=1 Tax=Elysia marginata TaxID=1093978 RepID=A0AAV4EGF3_9GAST|nr:hypothetical protein ElyMa_000065300 [Elysia marginata]